MGTSWYSRPVLYVSDMERSLAFYAASLGFKEGWRYKEQGVTKVAQVERDGCELILSAQARMNTGPAHLFISLDADNFDTVRRDLEGRGAPVSEGFWGYRSMIIADPDGNELIIPYPEDQQALV